MLSTFKKIAIATLIAAPFVADFVARSIPDPVAPTEVSMPAPPPAPVQAAAAVPIKPVATVPISAPSLAGIDPLPTLDPNAPVPGLAAPPQALPQPQAQPAMPVQAPQGSPATAPAGAVDVRPAPLERTSNY